jgi:hypothetical protein
MFYDARYGTSIYGSLFNPLTAEPFPSYYAFTAFNELYKLGDQVKTVLHEDGVYAVSAKSGKKGCVVIANTTENDIPLEISMNATETLCYMTSNGENEKRTDHCGILPKESIVVIHTEMR